VQVQFQFGQNPADLLALLQAQQQQSDLKTAGSKKSKAALAKDAKVKAQELLSHVTNGNDNSVSSQSDVSWHERAQVGIFFSLLLQV
jgi:hypothetical protein